MSERSISPTNVIAIYFEDLIREQWTIQIQWKGYFSSIRAQDPPSIISCNYSKFLHTTNNLNSHHLP